ncbi:MAG: Ig-like domain-containing protein, partial [Pseudomonadota bacterium]
PTLIQPANNGTVTFDPDGSFVYTPDAGFSGLDTFIYEISDLSGLSAQAVVSITVTSPVIEVEKQSAAIDTSGTATFYLPGNEV